MRQEELGYSCSKQLEYFLDTGYPIPGRIIKRYGLACIGNINDWSTINPNTGDYSRGASGFWIENGEVQYPISELTIAGNLNHMLKIIPANDARQYISRVVPSLLIDGMTIAGS